MDDDGFDWAAYFGQNQDSQGYDVPSMADDEAAAQLGYEMSSPDPTQAPHLNEGSSPSLLYSPPYSSFAYADPPPDPYFDQGLAVPGPSSLQGQTSHISAESSSTSAFRLGGSDSPLYQTGQVAHRRTASDASAGPKAPSSHLTEEQRTRRADTRSRGSCMWCRLRKIPCNMLPGSDPPCDKCDKKKVRCYPIGDEPKDKLRLAIQLCQESPEAADIRAASRPNPYPEYVNIKIVKMTESNGMQSASQIFSDTVNLTTDVHTWHLPPFGTPTVHKLAIQNMDYLADSAARLLSPETNHLWQAAPSHGNAGSDPASEPILQRCLGYMLLSKLFLAGNCSTYEHCQYSQQATLTVVEAVFLTLMAQVSYSLRMVLEEIFKNIKWVQPEEFYQRNHKLLLYLALAKRVLEEVGATTLLRPQARNHVTVAMMSTGRAAQAALLEVQVFIEAMHKAMELRGYQTLEIRPYLEAAIPPWQSYRMMLHYDLDEAIRRRAIDMPASTRRESMRNLFTLDRSAFQTWWRGTRTQSNAVIRLQVPQQRNTMDQMRYVDLSQGRY